MNPTDTQLKQALAKMLPNQVYFNSPHTELNWTQSPINRSPAVLDTELLYLCQLARSLHKKVSKLSCDATWQKQVVELCNKLKIEIV